MLLEGEDKDEIVEGCSIMDGWLRSTMLRLAEIESDIARAEARERFLCLFLIRLLIKIGERGGSVPFSINEAHLGEARFGGPNIGFKKVKSAARFEGARAISSRPIPI